MIGISSRGDHNKTANSLLKIARGDIFAELDRYAQMGVQALARATPKDSGLTANSWTYKIFRGAKPGIAWYNTNMIGGTSVAVLIQYGHATGTGGYVPGYDFINPAIQPILDQITEHVWKKVKSV